MDSNPSHRENNNILVWPWNACGGNGPSRVLMQTGKWQPAHLGWQRMSEDGKQISLDHSPGQALQDVPEPVDMLRHTWLTKRPWKHFLNHGATKLTTSLKYENHSNYTLRTLFPTAWSLRRHQMTISPPWVLMTARTGPSPVCDFFQINGHCSPTSLILVRNTATSPLGGLRACWMEDPWDTDAIGGPWQVIALYCFTVNLIFLSLLTHNDTMYSTRNT